MLSVLALTLSALQADPHLPGQEPQRQAVEDFFTVRVFEADGSPSVGREVTAILEGGLVVNSSIDDASDAEIDLRTAFYGERTDQEGVHRFERAEALETARRFTGHTRGEIWVSGTLGIVKQVSVDYASQREVTIHLPETTQLLVRLPPEVPEAVYLKVADADDNKVYTCGGPSGKIADPLGEGWYRIDPIPLDQHLEMRVHRLSDKIMVTSSPFSGLAMIPLENVRGPNEYGEHKKVELEWRDFPIYHGRFVDAQGMPFEFHQTTSYSFLGSAFVEGQSRAAVELHVEGFEDGTFFALPSLDGDTENIPDLDRVRVRWAAPEPEAMGHLAYLYEVEERLKTERFAAWKIADPKQRGLIALGDLTLDSQDPLIEFKVTDEEGEPIPYATIALWAHRPQERRSDWVGFSRVDLRTNQGGLAPYSAPDWRSAVTQYHAEESWQDELPRMVAHVNADGFARRLVEFDQDSKSVTVQLTRERVLEGRVHASMLNRLERYSRQLQIYAVEPNGHVDWKEHLWSKPIPRETSWSKDNWMSFRLAGLPAERFDLVFRVAHQDFEIARLRSVHFEELEQPFELDLDGYVEFVQLTLLGPEGAEIRSSKENRVNVVCHYLPRYPNNPFHFAQWHDGYWWLPVNRERGWLQPMDLEVKGYRPVRLEGVAPGALTLQLEREEVDETDSTRRRRSGGGD